MRKKSSCVMRVGLDFENMVGKIAKERGKKKVDVTRDLARVLNKGDFRLRVIFKNKKR